MKHLTPILLAVGLVAMVGCNTQDPITTGPGNNDDNNQNAQTNSQSNGQTNSAMAVCGDGTIDADEACDDGNTMAGDGCSATCTVEECGNGTVEGDEACDDGNTESGDGCSDACIVEECGNSVVDAGEVCDDGNTTAGDGCSADCTSDETCGNGTVDTDEVCDDGNTESGDGCSADCTSDETCGNGIVDTDEACDDGNTTSNDGCSEICELDCATDLQLCQMECFDTQTNNEHCGDCDSPCGPAQQCGGGTCDIGLHNCTVSADVFPLAIPNANYGLGQVTFDTDCSLLLVHHEPSAVVRVDNVTGAITRITDAFSTDQRPLGVVRRPADGLVYATTAGSQLWSIDDQGNSNLVGTLAQQVTSVVVAPASFGNYGGQLVGTTSAGDVVAIDHTSAAFTMIYDGTSQATDLEFGPSGRLYILIGPNNDVLSIDSTGTSTMVGDLSSAAGTGADGIAISPDELTIYVAASDTDALFGIDIASGAVTDLGNYDFDSGYYVTGLVADSTGTVFMGTGETSMTITTYQP